MLSLRRTTYPVRVEMTPLIDVIFLLLTFFIYSLVMTVRAQIMPVTLTPVNGASAQSSPAAIDAITIGSDGRIYFNKTPLNDTELTQRLKAYASDPAKRRLYVAMASQSEVDRGPLLIGLIEKLRQAGIDDFAIVGQPPSNPKPPTSRTADDGT